MKAAAELEDVVSALARHKVDYLLCGGFAVSLYGVPRITMDINLLLRFTKENVQRFISAATEMQYVKALPLRLEVLVDEGMRKKFIAERNLIAYSFYSTLSGKMALDVMIDVPIPFDELWNRREIRKSAGGSPVQLVSRADLMVMKAYAGRDKDQADIILLSRMQNFLGK